MDLSEITRYLYASLAHSICIDVREIPEAPGTLRTVTLRNDNSVSIEYPPALEYATGDFEGGGLKYRAVYPNIEAAVADLEAFLGKPLADWTNYTQTPLEPTLLDAPDPEGNWAYYEDQVRQRAIPLPANARYELTGIHWRHVELYGEYRQDKLGEESTYDDEADEDGAGESDRRTLL